MPPPSKEPWMDYSTRQATYGSGRLTGTTLNIIKRLPVKDQKDLKMELGKLYVVALL